MAKTLENVEKEVSITTIAETVIEDAAEEAPIAETLVAETLVENVVEKDPVAPSVETVVEDVVEETPFKYIYVMILILSALAKISQGEEVTSDSGATHSRVSKDSECTTKVTTDKVEEYGAEGTQHDLGIGG